MNTELIRNWLLIVPTEVTNTNDIEYKKFIQLYFILNNFFCEVFPLGNCKSKDGQRMKEEFPKLVFQNWGNIEYSTKREIKDIHLIILKHIKFAIDNHFYITKDKNDFSFTELIKIKYSEGDGYIKTKSDAILFKKLSLCNYNNLSGKKAEIILKSTLTILYGVRNNFYHGGKSRLTEQTQLLSYMNNVILRILKILIKIKPELYDTKINQALAKLGNGYNNERVNITIDYSRIINAPNLKFLKDFSSPDCDSLFNLIEEKWDTKKQEIRKKAKEIKSTACKYIDAYIDEADEEPTTYVKRLIGYLEINTYIQRDKKLTKRKIDLFRHLISLNTKRKSKIKEMLKVIYFLFDDSHINSQSISNVNICKNHIDLQIEKLVSTLKEEDFLDNPNIRNKFNILIKRDLKKYLVNEKSSINDWINLPSNSYFKFAINFIIFEQINSIINRVIYSDDSIIERLKILSTFLEIPFEDEENKDIKDYEDIYDNIYAERKKIFHGDTNTTIDTDSINELNLKLQNFTKGIYKWLKKITDFE